MPTVQYGVDLQVRHQFRLAADHPNVGATDVNITGFGFPVSPNEEWDIEAKMACAMTGTSGCKYYFTAPAGTIGDMLLQGNVATLPTWQSLYQAAITLPGTFFINGAITGLYLIAARILVGANAGTIQLVGRSGGATTTLVPKRGSVMKAIRINP